ncbi:MAG: hypothetical protein KW788_04780 [Candidatus Doudnabacteria bacterium]|nr:hypothetical protein [Candidatus Doudnabacteria bacterium]
MNPEIPHPIEEAENDNPSYGSREGAENYKKNLDKQRHPEKYKDEPEQKPLSEFPAYKALKKKLGTKPPSPTR